MSRKKQLKAAGRLIPATMATQHPDNAGAPYWEKDGDGFVSTQEEVRECASAFADLGVDEYMWDWEGKHVDEAVIDKLFTQYHDYFAKHQLGREKFLTFRIPNIWHEKGYSLARAFMAILTARDMAADLGFYTPPIFEVILPMADRAAHLIYIQKTFQKLAVFKNKLFAGTSSGDDFESVSIIPLIEGTEMLSNCRKILDDYVDLHDREFKAPLTYLRPFIARSDPALNSGLVPAVLAAKAALSESYRFGEEKKVEVFPIIGVGSMPFRGGLSPARLSNFMDEYAGTRTVTVQSAFRYDFKHRQVTEGIRKLNERLGEGKPRLLNDQEMTEAKKMDRLFSRFYRPTIEKLAPLINELAASVPKRRERRLHIGLFGYSREVKGQTLPRAIGFAASLYSLGLPPELIGTGRGWQNLNQSQRRVLGRIYLKMSADIKWAGRYLNKENLVFLAKKYPALADFQKDVEILESEFGELGPKNEEDYRHRNAVSDVYFSRMAKSDLSQRILEAGRLRRSLG